MRTLAQGDQNQYPPAAGDMFEYLPGGALFREEIAIAHLFAERRYRCLHTYLFVRTY